MLNIHFDAERYEDPYFALNQTAVIKGNRFFNDSGEMAAETREYVTAYTVFEDNGVYTIGENPVFVNPTLGDYRIRDGVDFPDYHFENIGRY